MLTYNSKLAAELKKGKSDPATLVYLQDSIFFDEKISEADWILNTSENNVDYTPSPPDGGNVILSAVTVPVEQNLIGNTWGLLTQVVEFSIQANQNWQSFKQNAGLKEINLIKGYFKRNHSSSAYDIKCSIWNSSKTIQISTTLIQAVISETGEWLTFDFSSQDISIDNDIEYWIRFTATYTGSTPPPVLRSAHQYYQNTNVYIKGQFDRTGDSPGTDLGDLVFTSTFTGDYYEVNGYLTTDNFDLGSVPISPGEWKIGDVVPAGTSLTYEAWGSTTGLNDNYITESQTGSDSSSIIASRITVPRFAQDWQSFKYATGDWGKVKEIKATFSKTFGGSHDIRVALYDSREGAQIGVDVIVALTTSGSTPTELTFDFSGQSLDLLDDTTYWIKFFTTMSVPLAGNLVHQIYNSDTSSYLNGQLDYKNTSGSWNDNIGDAKFEVTIDNVWGEYIGAFQDGDSITILTQYYRVKTSFTSSPLRDKTPTLSSITADFAEYLKIDHSIGLTSLTTTIDLFEESTISQMTVTLALTKVVSNWMATKNPRNKRVRIFIGFRAEGFTDADFEKFYFGTVANADITADNKVKIYVEGLAKDWKEDVPNVWENASDNVVWTDEHPIDVMLDIYREYLPVRDSALLLSSFYDVKAETPGWVVTRTITDDPIEGKKLLEELRKLMSCFFIPQPDGSVKIKRWDPSEAAVAAITDTRLMSKNYKGNYKEIINRLYIYFDWVGTGDDAGDFNQVFPDARSDSKDDYGKFETETIKDKWTKADELAQVEDRSIKLLDRYENPPPLLPVGVDLKNLAIEEGDIIDVTTKRAPSTDMTGISAVRFQLVKKQINWQKKTLSWELLAVVG